MKISIILLGTLGIVSNAAWADDYQGNGNGTASLFSAPACFIHESTQRVVCGRSIVKENAEDSIAIGTDSEALYPKAVALGASSVADRVASKAHNKIDVVIKPTDNLTQVYGIGSDSDKEAITKTVTGDLAAVSVGKDAQTRQIIHVAAGSADTDAVNVAQLKAVGNHLEKVSSALHKRIDDVDKQSSAGTASAMAAAGLPQAYLPGHSMVAVAAGTHRGQNGLAVGVSHISDNGNVVIKLNSTTNSKGDISGSLGMGYQW